MPLYLLVAGRRACFRRPEFKRDLITYDAITPPVARIIFERLYHPPGLHWSIDRIKILNPIKRGWEPATSGDESRRILTLHDVGYRLSATIKDLSGHDRCDDHELEFNKQISLAATNPIHLGLREFTARIATASSQSPEDWADRPIDLGWMPFDTGKGPGAEARFFHAVAVAGVIDLTNLNGDSFAT